MSDHFNDMELEPVQEPSGVLPALSSVDRATLRPVTAAAPDVPAPDDPTDEPGPDEQDDQPAEQQNGVIICALPAEADPAQQIGDGGGDGLHCTLVYFGDVPTDGAENPNTLLTDDFRTTVTALVQAAAEAGAPFDCAVTGVESLGDEGARVWMLDTASPVVDLQAELTAGQEVRDVQNGVEQYPEFTPHVTIGYPEPGEPDQTPTALDEATEAAAAEVTSISFDRLAVWWAGEQTEFPLGGTPDTSGQTETPADVAAALDVLQAFVSQRPLPTRAQSYADAVGSADPPPTTGPAKAQDIPADGDPFYGIAWPEDVASGDSRGVQGGGTTWRDLPLPLMFQDATALGHDGAVRAGRIDTLERDDTTYSVPVIRYAGVWDTSAAAVEAARQVDARMVRGVSVDGDRVTVELRGSDGSTLDPMVDDFPDDGVVIEVATEARISGATVCSVPAFHQAYIANGTLAGRTEPEPGWNADGSPKDNLLTEPGQMAEGEDYDDPEEPEAVAASAAPAWSLVASGGDPWDLPVWAHSDFTCPAELAEEPQRLTITDDGRTYGYLAVWGTCHIGIDGVCTEPPDSASNYAYMCTGKVQTDEGLVAVGQLTMGTGHADLYASHRAAVEHYDNTGAAVADVAFGQNAVGIWFAGRIRPTATPEQVFAMRASGSVSGDWRPIGTGLELVAALVVNVPGFPIPAPAVAASAAGPLALVAAGVVRPGAEATPAPTYDEATIVARVVETLDRRARRTAATARLRATRRRQAAARLNRIRRD